MVSSHTSSDLVSPVDNSAELASTNDLQQTWDLWDSFGGHPITDFPEVEQEQIRKWWFPKLGVPPVIIHFRWDFPS